MKNKREHLIETEKIDTISQTPIEIALSIDENGMTTASKLYSFLELYPKHFARWCNKNILNNKFAIKNKDYIPFTIEGERYNPKPRQDYKITAIFAKKLSMTGNTQKHEQARNYFIACEQGLKIISKKINDFQIDLQSLAESILILTKTIAEIQAQTTETNEILARILRSNKKEIFKSDSFPAWTNKMMSNFIFIKEYYFPEDKGYKSTYAKIFTEFSKKYGSYVLHQASNDFCYQNNCEKCNTMDMVAYTPEIRAKMEMVINSIVKEIIKLKKEETKNKIN